MDEDPRKEWEECFDQMDKFDGYLIDARKYGFTLITGLTTASSFLGFSDATQTIQLGVIIVTMVLVGVVYLIDRYYQILLRTALLRSMSIESDDIPSHSRGLGHHLATTYGKKIMKYLVFNIYLGFVIALFVLGYYAINAAVSQTDSQNTTPSIELVQATNVQEGGDLTSTLWETASLWIPLAVTAILIVALLVIIFRAELVQTRRIDLAESVIKNYEEKEEQRYREEEQQPGDFQPGDFQPGGFETKPEKKKKIEIDMKKVKRDKEILDYLEGNKEHEGKKNPN